MSGAGWQGKRSVSVLLLLLLLGLYSDAVERATTTLALRNIIFRVFVVVVALFRGAGRPGLRVLAVVHFDECVCVRLGGDSFIASVYTTSIVCVLFTERCVYVFLFFLQRGAAEGGGATKAVGTGGERWGELL